VPDRGRQTRAQRIQSGVQPLLDDLAVDHQATTMAHRGPQRIYHRFLAVTSAA